MRACSRCRKTKPEGDFRVRPGKPPLKTCKRCEADAQNRRRREDIDGVRAIRAASARRRRADPVKGAAIREYNKRYYRNGGAEKERARREARKRADFFGWRAQYIRRHNPAITAADLERLWDTQGGKCGLTGQPMEQDERAQLDHIVPIARGGSHELANLRWTTRDANQAKRDLTDDEFVALCRHVAEWIGLGFAAVQPALFEEAA